MKLLRYRQNPILAPTTNWWEQKAVFNPGAAVYRDHVYLLYRAIGFDGISRLGLATSDDGKHFRRFDTPVVEGDQHNVFQRLGIEDPRITKFGNKYYIVFTEASVYSCKHTGTHAPSLASETPWRVRMSCISTTNFKTFRHEADFIPRTDSKDGALFPEKIGGQYVLMHRIYPDVYISFSSNLHDFGKGEVLFTPQVAPWTHERVGAGAQPIKTKDGWLLIFHGTDNKRIYRIGAMLLDLKDPRKILSVTKEPLMEPEEEFEITGTIPNVVFTCGVVERGEEFYVYYGGADKVIGLATIKKEDLFSLLR